MEKNRGCSNLICQLKDAEPWQRRRAVRFLKASTGRVALAEVLRELVFLPEDVLPEVLEWLSHWRWPMGVAPSPLEIMQCVKLMDHSNPAIASTAIKLLQSLRGQGKLLVNQTVHPLKYSQEARTANLPLLTIDLASSQVSLGDAPCDLTQYQKRMLYRLAESRGHYVSAGDLYSAAQGEYYAYDQPGDVKSNVKNLRGRLGDDGTRQYYIQSKKHIGYRINLQNVKVVK